MLTLLQKPRASILVQLFKLSPAENRLAELLAQGLKPDECADALCVSINTVRSQLRAIFQKTGTSRQSELIGLIHRLAVLVPAPQDHPRR
ncbi:helix-turn-helix transcriptional regulator [Azotobacter sp. CWF10]